MKIYRKQYKQQQGDKSSNECQYPANPICGWTSPYSRKCQKQKWAKPSQKYPNQKYDHKMIYPITPHQISDDKAKQEPQQSADAMPLCIEDGSHKTPNEKS
jgi:hypothetical protein